MSANPWRDRPVLVTGGTGLLGGRLAHRLVAAGAEVTCLVRDWVPRCELVRTGLIERVGVVRGDLGDLSLLERILGEHEIRTVFHLAAQTIVGVANRNPASTFEANVRGTWTALEAARRSPAVAAVVVASSDKAYGEADHLPYDESTPLRGRHPYDASKACADLIAQSYAVTFGLPVAITRCGNLYGGGDLNWSRIVPGTIRSVLKGEPPVIRSDGRFVRDYLYVEDAVSFAVRLAEALADRPESLRGEAFNVSIERPVTVLDLVRRILDRLGSDLPPVILNQASHEIVAQFLCAEKARRVLGWRPEFTLEQGLDETIAWYRAALSAAAETPL